MIQKLKEILEGKSTIAETVAGIGIILLIAGSYFVKYCCSSILLKMILRLASVAISSFFVFGATGTVACIIKYTKKIRSRADDGINETELKNDLFHLKRSKTEFIWCLVITIIFAILALGIIVRFGFGDNMEFADDMISIATDIVAVIGVMNTVAKNHCNLVISKYVDKYWVGKNEQSEQRIAK